MKGKVTRKRKEKGGLPPSSSFLLPYPPLTVVLQHARSRDQLRGVADGRCEPRGNGLELLVGLQAGAGGGGRFCSGRRRWGHRRRRRRCCRRRRGLLRLRLRFLSSTTGSSRVFRGALMVGAFGLLGGGGGRFAVVFGAVGLVLGGGDLGGEGGEEKERDGEESERGKGRWRRRKKPQTGSVESKKKRFQWFQVSSRASFSKGGQGPFAS